MNDVGGSRGGELRSLGARGKLWLCRELRLSSILWLGDELWLGWELGLCGKLGLGATPSLGLRLGCAINIAGGCISSRTGSHTGWTGHRRRCSLQWDTGCLHWTGESGALGNGRGRCDESILSGELAWGKLARDELTHWGRGEQWGRGLSEMPVPECGRNGVPTVSSLVDQGVLVRDRGDVSGVQRVADTGRGNVTRDLSCGSYSVRGRVIRDAQASGGNNRWRYGHLSRN